MARGFCLSIDSDFITHVKTRKLCRLTGNESAPLHLISLWSWAAEFAPDGDLSEIDIPEIEDGARYHGAPGLLYQGLVAAGFIDEDHDGRRVHNWMQPGHTGYALAQTEKARDRWRRAKGIPTRNASHLPGDSARNTPGIREDSAVLHGSRFTVQEDPDLSPTSDPIPLPSLPPERAIPVPPGTSVVPPARPTDPVSGPGLGILFAEVRAEVLGGLPWKTPRLDPAKAASAADAVNENAARAELRPSLEEFWRSVRDGTRPDAQKCSDSAAWAFGCWAGGFQAFVERARGLAPKPRPAARAGPKDVRTGHVRAEDCDHTASGRQEL